MAQHKRKKPKLLSPKPGSLPLFYGLIQEIKGTNRYPLAGSYMLHLIRVRNHLTIFLNHLFVCGVFNTESPPTDIIEMYDDKTEVWCCIPPGSVTDNEEKSAIQRADQKNRIVKIDANIEAFTNDIIDELILIPNSFDRYDARGKITKYISDRVNEIATPED